MPNCSAYPSQPLRNRRMTVHTVTLSQLESHLWEAANILRGPVDAADFKTYVFPLLFFRRLSDVHDEEYEAALAESAGDEEYALFPQNYRFQVPENCHWRDVREVVKCHLNYVVADTKQWEQSAAYYIDTSEVVDALVKNSGL